MLQQEHVLLRRTQLPIMTTCPPWQLPTVSCKRGKLTTRKLPSCYSPMAQSETARKSGLMRSSQPIRKLPTRSHAAENFRPGAILFLSLSLKRRLLAVLLVHATQTSSFRGLATATGLSINCLSGLRNPAVGCFPYHRLNLRRGVSSIDKKKRIVALVSLCLNLISKEASLLLPTESQFHETHT